jgi:hypothetical protein
VTAASVIFEVATEFEVFRAPSFRLRPSIVTPFVGVDSLIVSTLGVTSVGVEANTSEPVPVSSVTLAAIWTDVSELYALEPVPLPIKKVLFAGVLAPVPNFVSIALIESF